MRRGQRSRLSDLFKDDDEGGGGLFGDVAADDGDDPFRYSRPRDPFTKKKEKPKPKPKPQEEAPPPLQPVAAPVEPAKPGPPQKEAYVMTLTLRALFCWDAPSRSYKPTCSGPVGCLCFGTLSAAPCCRCCGGGSSHRSHVHLSNPGANATYKLMFYDQNKKPLLAFKITPSVRGHSCSCSGQVAESRAGRGAWLGGRLGGWAAHKHDATACACPHTDRPPPGRELLRIL